MTPEERANEPESITTTSAKKHDKITTIDMGNVKIVVNIPTTSDTFIEEKRIK